MATNEIANLLDLWREENATVVVYGDHQRTYAYKYDKERQAWWDGRDGEIIIDQPPTESSEIVTASHQITVSTHVTCEGCWNNIPSDRGRIAMYWGGYTHYYHDKHCAKRHLEGNGIPLPFVAFFRGQRDKR